MQKYGINLLVDMRCLMVFNWSFCLAVFSLFFSEIC